MKEFSVLISVYHKEKPAFLAKALDSIWGCQSLKASEIVLVKDGALGDELDSVITEFEQVAPVKVIVLKENQGLGRALSIGLKHCSYELVARMDSDDVSYPDRFEKQIEFMLNNPKIAVVGAWIKEFDSHSGEIYSSRKMPESSSSVYELMKRRNALSHPSVVFRKSMIERVGGYIHYPLLEDYNLWIRVIMNGGEICNIQDYLLLFRAGPEVVKRRGGYSYLKTELDFQKWMLKIKFISLDVFFSNSFKRIFVRLLPNRLRFYLYNLFMRDRIREDE